MCRLVNPDNNNNMQKISKISMKISKYKYKNIIYSKLYIIIIVLIL